MEHSPSRWFDTNRAAGCRLLAHGRTSRPSRGSVLRCLVGGCRPKDAWATGGQPHVRSSEVPLTDRRLGLLRSVGSIDPGVMKLPQHRWLEVCSDLAYEVPGDGVRWRQRRLCVTESRSAMTNSGVRNGQSGAPVIRRPAARRWPRARSLLALAVLRWACGRPPGAGGADMPGSFPPGVRLWCGRARPMLGPAVGGSEWADGSRHLHDGRARPRSCTGGGCDWSQ